MAIWQNSQQTNSDDFERRYRDIANMALASRVDPMTAVGYGLGKLIGGYVDRGQERNQREALESNINQGKGGLLDGILNKTQGSVQQIPTSQLVNHIGDGLQFNYSNNTEPFTNLLGDGFGSVQQTANGASGRTSTTELLPGLGKGSTTELLPGLGAASSIKNIANGNAGASDILNLTKTFFPFFDGAATDNNQSNKAAISNDENNQGLAKELVENNTTQQQPLDYVGRKMAEQLVGAKNAYLQGQALNNTSLMNQAAATAESIRQSAKRSGIDLSPYDSIIPLESAQQSLQNDYYTGINKILNKDLTSDEYYYEIYNQVRANGGTDTQARKLAGEKAGIYQAKRLARLSSAMHNYGLGDSGAINQIGSQILMQMQQEDSNSANGLLGMYATPKDDYGVQTGRENAAIQHGYGLDNMDHQFELNQKGADNDLARKEKFAAFDLSNKKDFTRFTAEINRLMANASAEDKIKLFTALGATMPEIKQAFGITSENNQLKVKMNAAKVIIDDFNNYIKNGGEAKEYPNKEAYEQAVKLNTSLLGNGQVSSGLGGTEQEEKGNDANSYQNKMRIATHALEANQKQGKKYSKEALINRFKQEFGYDADTIINDINWNEWGY